MSRTSIIVRRMPALLLGLAACSKKDAGTDAAMATDTTSTPPAAVAVAPGTPGAPVTLAVVAKPGEATFVTDASGRAVYYIASPDGNAMVECVGECATVFDPVTGNAVVATGDTTVKVALIGQVTRRDGTTQVTYGGKPIYYHRGDQPGTTSAQGMKTAGGEAALIGPDGNKASRSGR
jgi:predicted lipoprotein with Yx(FWY)xxD motif